MHPLCTAQAESPSQWSRGSIFREKLSTPLGWNLDTEAGARSREGWGLYDRAIYGIQFSILAFFYSALLLVAVTGNFDRHDKREDKFVRTVLCNVPLMKLGAIAYGTYLLHVVLIDFSRFLLTYHRPHSPAIAFFAANVLGIAGAITIASLSWRYFEKPMVHRGHAYDFTEPRQPRAPKSPRA